MSADGANNGIRDNQAGHAAHAEHYDPEAIKIGMWLFLFTEVLLFGTLFIVYGVYLSDFTWQFRKGSAALNIPIGAINTVILLTSSLTMALAIAALQRSNRKLCFRMASFTLLFALAFLVIKAFEWGGKFEHGIYPGSPLFEDLTKGEIVFFGLYFTMTGLHALHVIVGMAVIFWAMALVRTGKVHQDRSVFLENTGLYWHLVDLVWIYLFPLFYLIS